MVMFDSYRLQNPQSVSIQDSEVLNERGIPGGSIPYRADQTRGGRVIIVSGEIRDVYYALRVEELRVRINDESGSLDLEDGSDAVTAKLGAIEVDWNVEDGLDRPTYAATFYET
jgi:hypothetical protein